VSSLTLHSCSIQTQESYDQNLVEKHQDSKNCTSIKEDYERKCHTKLSKCPPAGLYVRLLTLSNLQTAVATGCRKGSATSYFLAPELLMAFGPVTSTPSAGHPKCASPGD